MRGSSSFQTMALVPMCSHDFLDELAGFGSTCIFYFGAFFFTLGPLKGFNRLFQAMALVPMCSHDFSQFIDWVGIGIYI